MLYKNGAALLYIWLGDLGLLYNNGTALLYMLQGDVGPLYKNGAALLYMWQGDVGLLYRMVQHLFTWMGAAFASHKHLLKMAKDEPLNYAGLEDDWRRLL